MSLVILAAIAVILVPVTMAVWHFAFRTIAANQSPQDQGNGTEFPVRPAHEETGVFVAPRITAMDDAFLVTAQRLGVHPRQGVALTLESALTR